MIAIEQQGQVIRIVDLSPKNAPLTKPAKRGNVEFMSRKSRRRMIDLQSRLDLTDRRKTFITLTFHYTHNVSFTKACFKRFLAYLRYHYPSASGMWRLELQKRGTPHYHLIMFDLPYWTQKEMRATWMQCTREDKSGVRVNLLRDAKHAMYYVSKYVAKMPDHSGNTLFINAPYQQKTTETWHGRVWGVINKACLPMAERHTGIIVDEEVAGYFWSMASLNVTRPNEYRHNTTRIYSQDAKEMYAWCLSVGGFEITDCWHEYLRQKQLSPSQRTKASYFFVGLNTHH